jgi:hypothetical protein
VVVYAVTSFLFPLYAQDANTACAAELAETLHCALIVTPLQHFGLRNAIRLSVFRGDIAEDECGSVPGIWRRAVASWALSECLPRTPPCARFAQRLLGRRQGG